MSDNDDVRILPDGTNETVNRCDLCEKDTTWRQPPGGLWFCTRCGTRENDEEPNKAPIPRPMTRATMDRPSKSVFHYLGRLLLVGIVLVLLLFGGVAIYNALQPQLSGNGEGAISTPSSSGLISTDSYNQVDSHPELYQGDEINWHCAVQDFLGTDSSGNTVIGCNAYNPSDNYQMSEGEVIILAPSNVDVSAVNKGDDITVDGYVDMPDSGKTAMGVESSWPQISAASISDHGAPKTP